MKQLLLILSLLIFACSSTEENKEKSFSEKLNESWQDALAGNYDRVISDIETKLSGSSNSSELSQLQNILAWSYYLKADGLKSDADYVAAMNAFKASDEEDSKAGIAILGHLIEDYQNSESNALSFIDLTAYEHQYKLEKVNLKAVLLNGAWSSYYLKNWTTVKQFLDKLDPNKAHSTDSDELFDDLKGIQL